MTIISAVGSENTSPAATTFIESETADGVGEHFQIANLHKNMTRLTAAEINTGTDTSKLMPIDQFVASSRNVSYFVVRVIRYDSDWPADGTTGVSGAVPIPFTGTLTEIYADSDTAGTTGTAIVDVNLDGSTIMTTNKLKWDSTEKSTRTYSGTAPGLTTTAVTAGQLLTFDIDTNHTTKSKGLTVTLGIRKT